MAKLQDPRGELDCVAVALEDDAKNYHVWAYRCAAFVFGDLGFVAHHHH